VVADKLPSFLRLCERKDESSSDTQVIHNSK
jgi:hypothetical protein